MWYAEIQEEFGSGKEVLGVYMSEDLRVIVHNALSEAKQMINEGAANLWIPIWKDEGYTRYMLNVDENFVCYKCTDSDYVLINTRKGGIFNV